MAKRTDILLKEERHSDEDLYVIHFYNENGWWRAYEWSAYLCENFPNREENLRATKRKVKECEDGMIYVGLQMMSFKKYLPSLETKISGEISDDIMSLDIRDFFVDEFTFDNYKTLLREWKESVDFKIEENRSKKKATSTKLPFECNDKGKELKMFDIIQMLLAYDVLTHNINENSNFLIELKRKANSIMY